ncbi:MAG: hypothetical protein ABIN08_23505 [Caldimonas sp.]
MWLLAVALPMQGLSAATMLACGVGHEHPSGDQVSSHSHADHLTDVRSTAHFMDAAQHEHDTTNHTHGGKARLDKGSMQKCSACASCCVSAVLASQTISFDPVKLTDSFAPLATYTLAAFVPEGLERPPRLFLA